MAATVYAGSARFTTHEADRVTRHSFSFGPHYDPANLGFGPLVCHNDELLQPGGGYPDHPHRDLEIVTWVLSGVLLHTDSTGHTSPIGAGSVQAMSAGSGIRHSEIADLASGPTRFVQAWVRPDEPGGTPVHRELAVDLAGAGLVPVAGGGGLPIGTTGASLHVARLAPGESVELPDVPRLHVFTATGSVSVGGLHLGAGDALRLSDDPADSVDPDDSGDSADSADSADSGGAVAGAVAGGATADEPTDLLVWSFA